MAQMHQVSCTMIKMHDTSAAFKCLVFGDGQLKLLRLLGKLRLLLLSYWRA